ncbi:MAG: T9SS type A sorting domain-containing protein [Bacteroidia bacterium]|nr:T9SS type A sorting domain-containing protein [Bacteroidia bacterium]MBT8278360.1 T9SS type A sorting domain-containing protein [Bacteroidia bacterium]NND26550.1 T9SS type A sorting domain-containing protein [Flavobacteriaceae bacterium]NNK60107.1 T9SS type A sorting domain-containing protein [Flavobacteriaceae bacterium]NNL32146.1 T9SS type A sorting domain-containing protein [Flavobacteriaceae bacterium]
MKNNYTLLWLLSLLSFSFIDAQVCPETLGNSSTSTLVHFKIVSNSCIDYPSTISIAGSTFDKSSCNGTNLKYELSTGDPLSSEDTFSVDFGSGMVCDYLNGELRRETLSIDQFSNDVESVKVFPNPITTNSELNLHFSTSISAKIFIYDLIGKVVLDDEISNDSTKLLNVSNLNNGIYMLQIVTDTMSTTRKIVVMK